MVRGPRVVVVLAVAGTACGGGGGDPTDAAATADASPAADAACPACPPLPEFVGSWGEFGTGEGQFVEPSSVELHSDGVVIVAGHEDRIQRFTRDGELIDIFGSRGVFDGQFNHPHGLAVDRDRDDLIYVGDQENHRLQVFDRNGDFVRQWGDDGFQHIHDVGIDRESGDVFVGDYELDTLRKFSATGELLATYGGTGAEPGQFRGVWGVSTDSDGNVYVADAFNDRVQKLDRDGGFLAAWTSYGDGVAFEKPTGVYVDARDIVYVCDSLAEVVVLFDTDGTHLATWDLATIVGYRTEPEDMVIDAAGEHIYIGEVYGHSVLHLVLAPE